MKRTFVTARICATAAGKSRSDSGNDRQRKADRDPEPAVDAAHPIGVQVGGSRVLRNSRAHLIEAGTALASNDRLVHPHNRHLARAPGCAPWQILAADGPADGAASLAYWPALTGGFMWDDDTLVTESALVKAADGLYRMWFTTEPLDYWPLTNTLLLAGVAAVGHALRRVSRHEPAAAHRQRAAAVGHPPAAVDPGRLLAALLFVLHPVNVESVAWIAQRKNTLSMVFFLLSILWYCTCRSGPPETALVPSRRVAGTRQEHEPPGVAAAAASATAASTGIGSASLAFVLAMLSKGSVAILPGVLLLIAWWRRGSDHANRSAADAPFFVVGGGLTLLNIWFQMHLHDGRHS